MQCILEHNTTKFKRYFPNIEIKSVNLIYYQIEIDTSDYEDGEYTITLITDTNTIVAEEMIRIGNHNDNKQQYKVTKKYTQYVRK